MATFDTLPESCISHVLSFTSPQDACRSAATSPAFQSSLESDVLWEKFLPPDYRHILSRAVEPVVACASKKELYWRLCGSILIDGGRKSFSLDKPTGKKQFILSARDLHITWSNTPQYWRWLNHPDSRFTEVAELMAVCWLSITGRIDTSELSLNTTYGAYLVYKLGRQRRDGFEGRDQTSSVTIGGVAVQSTIQVLPRQSRMQTRPDGWNETRLGGFFSGAGCDGEVEICFWETDDYNWKHGLIVEGIEIRAESQ